MTLLCTLNLWSLLIKDICEAEVVLFKFQEYQSKLSKVSAVRHELKSHLQNLPDLTLLPDVTGGLAPLPSAGDLFSL